MRTVQLTDETPSKESDDEMSLQVADVGIQVFDDSQATIVRLPQRMSSLEEQLHASKFCLENISKDDKIIILYRISKICYSKNMLRLFGSSSTQLDLLG